MIGTLKPPTRQSQSTRTAGWSLPARYIEFFKTMYRAINQRRTAAGLKKFSLADIVCPILDSAIQDWERMNAEEQEAWLKTYATQ